jgi:hypothetical protein
MKIAARTLTHARVEIINRIAFIAEAFAAEVSEAMAPRNEYPLNWVGWLDGFDRGVGHSFCEPRAWAIQKPYNQRHSSSEQRTFEMILSSPVLRAGKNLQVCWFFPPQCCAPARIFRFVGLFLLIEFLACRRRISSKSHPTRTQSVHCLSSLFELSNDLPGRHERKGNTVSQDVATGHTR